METQTNLENLLFDGKNKWNLLKSFIIHFLIITFLMSVVKKIKFNESEIGVVIGVIATIITGIVFVALHNFMRNIACFVLYTIILIYSTYSTFILSSKITFLFGNIQNAVDVVVFLLITCFSIYSILGITLRAEYATLFINNNELIENRFIHKTKLFESNVIKFWHYLHSENKRGNNGINIRFEQMLFVLKFIQHTNNQRSSLYLNDDFKNVFSRFSTKIYLNKMAELLNIEIPKEILNIVEKESDLSFVQKLNEIIYKIYDWNEILKQNNHFKENINIGENILELLK